MTNYEMVQQFHERFRMYSRTTPGFPPDDVIELRMKLILEEFTELCDEIDAVKSPEMDLEKIAKELCDLLYVTYGFADTLGLPIDDIFREVHSSNMSKLDENGNPIYREDGKVKKSNQYRPADVSKYLKRY